MCDPIFPTPSLRSLQVRFLRSLCRLYSHFFDCKCLRCSPPKWDAHMAIRHALVPSSHASASIAQGGMTYLVATQSTFLFVRISRQCTHFGNTKDKPQWFPFEDIRHLPAIAYGPSGGDAKDLYSLSKGLCPRPTTPTTPHSILCLEDSAFQIISPSTVRFFCLI